MKAHRMLAPDATVNVQIDARKQSVAFFAKLTEEDLRALARGESVAPEGAIDAEALPVG
jgi:hypothetical protein